MKVVANHSQAARLEAENQALCARDTALVTSKDQANKTIKDLEEKVEQLEYGNIKARAAQQSLNKELNAAKELIKQQGEQLVELQPFHSLGDATRRFRYLRTLDLIEGIDLSNPLPERNLTSSSTLSAAKSLGSAIS